MYILTKHNRSAEDTPLTPDTNTPTRRRTQPSADGDKYRAHDDCSDCCLALDTGLAAEDTLLSPHDTLCLL